MQPESDCDFDLSDISNYNKNHNHKIKPGFVLINRYIIKQKLNKKNFFLAFDLKFGTYVALQIRNISYEEIDIDDNEINFLKKIYKKNFSEEWIASLKEYYKNNDYILSELIYEEHTNIIQMLNYFIYEEENSDEKYLCNVYEIMGISLQNFFDNYFKKNKKGLPLIYIKIIVKQILIGLDFIHRFGEIIHNCLNMDSILICLTKQELEMIQETGYIFFDEENENNILENKLINVPNNNKRISKRQKKIEKKGLSQSKKDANKNKDYIDINIDEIYKAINDEYNNNKNYDINDIINRPRISSVPKIDIRKNKYDFDINKYKNEIQSYLKEKRKIKLDDKYRKNIFIKNKLLENINSNNTNNIKARIDIYKKINKEFIISNSLVNSDIKIKIAEFKHYIKLNKKKRDIFLTTKQRYHYLSPEVIFGLNYNESIDIWALGCLIFELATGDSLFKVKRDNNFSQNENYILKFIEILGNIPKKIIMQMKNPKIYIDLYEKINKSKNKQKTNIKNILIEKYNFNEQEAQGLYDFLSLIFNYFPDERPSAKELLSHPWLNINNNNISNGIINTNKEEEYNYLNNNNSEEYSADNEDNDKSEKYDEEQDDDSGDENPDKIIIQNFNNSFAEYGQFIDLTNSDKANPQFDEILNKNF